MTEAVDLAMQSIRKHEGTVVDAAGWHLVYDDRDGARVDWTLCCKGHPTVGYGHNLRRGVSERFAMDLLRDDTTTAEAECRQLFSAEMFRFLSPVRQAVLIELCFAMGMPALKGFVQMIAAVRAHAYDAAAAEILDSEWARTVGDAPGQRAYVLAERMRTGQW